MSRLCNNLGFAKEMVCALNALIDKVEALGETENAEIAEAADYLYDHLTDAIYWASRLNRLLSRET